MKNFWVIYSPFSSLKKHFLLIKYYGSYFILFIFFVNPQE